MKKTQRTDANRTGIASAPALSKLMVEGVNGVAPTEGDEDALRELGEEAIRSATPVGTVPMPAAFQGPFAKLTSKSKHKHLEVLIDAMGERLAFERMGVRVYQLFIEKCLIAEAADTLPTGLSIEAVRQFCMEEQAHFLMLRDALLEMGADPTAVTPAANIAGVAGSGLLHVVQDPRTTVVQCMSAMLTIELTDNDAWALLIDLVDELGIASLKTQFEEAYRQEEVHLSSLRSWCEDAMLERAGVAPEARAA